jgi:hypothetical protein
MTCSIINRTTQTTIGRNQVLDKSQSSVSGLQRPDINRMTLDALMRKQMRVRQGNARPFWSYFMNRNDSANTNIPETAAV